MGRDGYSPSVLVPTTISAPYFMPGVSLSQRRSVTHLAVPSSRVHDASAHPAMCKSTLSSWPNNTIERRQRYAYHSKDSDPLTGFVVVVAMSGGVDSSVTAKLLADASNVSPVALIPSRFNYVA